MDRVGEKLNGCTVPWKTNCFETVRNIPNSHLRLSPTVLINSADLQMNNAKWCLSKYHWIEDREYE